MISRLKKFGPPVAVACLALLALAAPASAAAPAWQPIAATGPTVLPPLQSEVQSVFVEAEGGTYTLGVATGSANVTTADGSADVTIMAASYGSFSAGDGVSFTGVSAPTIAGGTTVVSCSPSCSAPTSLTLSNPVIAGGGADKTLVASQVTAPIAYDAPASGAGSLAAALEALPGVGPGTTVTGGPGGPGAKAPYAVTFGGSLSNADLEQMKGDGAGLSGAYDPNVTMATTVPGGKGTTELALWTQNIGGYTASGPITYKVTLPSGVSTTATPTGGEFLEGWRCSEGAQTEFTCTFSKGPFEAFLGPVQVAPSKTPPPIKVTITSTGTPGTGIVHTEVSGAGAPSASFDLPLTVSSTPASPGAQSFVAGAYDSNGAPDTRAGGHPYSANTAIFANTKRTVGGAVIPVGDFRDIVVDLPPGFLGNPIAVPQCPESVKEINCPLDTMVGVVQPIIALGGTFGEKGYDQPVYNTEAPYGAPAKFRFNILGADPINAVGSLRSDEDYGITVASFNTPQISQVYGVFFSFWGAPADPSHDSSRCTGLLLALGMSLEDITCENSSQPNIAFLTSATNCAEQASVTPVTSLHSNTWQRSGKVFTESVEIPPVTGCDKLKFESDFTFEPSNTVADSPAAFRTSLTVPSEGLIDASKLATPEIKDTVVALPKGVVLNASGADGLQACSLEQIGFKGKGFPMPNPMRFNKDPNQCPEASKIGTGELKTPLLEEPLHGALYLAAQGDGNPFGSLFAIYLVIEDPRHGIFIKLPGKVEPDPQTGQMTVTFQNLPQLPFTRLDLNLKGGNRSALASPTTCGNYVTTATNTPWSAPESGPPTVSSNGFDINQGPNGMPCANTPQERPFDIGWNAGADSTKSSVSSPFQFQVTRRDGSQELTGLELSTPKGLSASLKGIPYCSAAQIAQAEGSTGKHEQSNPTCPQVSQVGTLQTGAGSGPSPFYVDGKIYLAGPYKGAPISVVAITPAVAGPFDLGNVVVRSAVFIDRTTAQVSAKTDAIPQILKGVALRVKDVRIKLDHKDWTINPTSCDASSVNLKATGNSGATAERSTRFQVGGCNDLNFKPKFKAKLTGGTKRAQHPVFTAELSYSPGPGYANIKDFQVTLPHSEFLEQSHINTICTRAQAAANQCPQGSIYGYAEATTPLVDAPLTGPVFLKSSNHKLPDLAIALKGPASQPVEVEFAGRIDSIKGQIRNTIEGLPDVPVTKFVLKMKGGNKGLLVNSRNLCASKTTKMTVKMTGQNNKLAESRPPLTRSCKGKKPKKAKKGKGKRQGRARSSGLVGGL